MTRNSPSQAAASFRLRARRSASAAALSLAAFALSCGAEQIIDVNDRIHHDDFEYRVTRFRVTDAIGSGTAQIQAAGCFYIVTFEVENRAKRVTHEWDNSIAYLVDDQGRKYENLPEAQAALNRAEAFNYAERHRTAAGDTEQTRLVFDLPRNITRPYLMVRGEILMGDVFAGAAFSKIKVRLF